MSTRNMNIIDALRNQRDYNVARKHEVAVKELHTTRTMVEQGDNYISFVVAKTVHEKHHNSAYNGTKSAEIGDFAYVRCSLVVYHANGTVEKEQIGTYFGSYTTRQVAETGQVWRNSQLVKYAKKATVIHLAHMAKERFGFDEADPHKGRYGNIVAEYTKSNPEIFKSLEVIDVDLSEYDES